MDCLIKWKAPLLRTKFICASEHKGIYENWIGASKRECRAIYNNLPLMMKRGRDVKHDSLICWEAFTTRYFISSRINIKKSLLATNEIFAHAAREPDLRAAFLKAACNNNNISLPFFAQPTTNAYYYNGSVGWAVKISTFVTKSVLRCKIYGCVQNSGLHQGLKRKSSPVGTKN